MTNNYTIPELNKDIFTNDPNKPLGSEDILAYISDKPLEYVPYQGIILHIQGATYPKKGFPTPESVAAINIVKELIKNVVRFPIFLLLVNKNKLLNTFNTLFDKIFNPYKLNEIYLCPTAFNFAQMVSNFLINLGIPTVLSSTFGYNIAHTLEYDDAYRYRLQDILTETTHNQLTTNPRKEIKRLLTILHERNGKENGVARKIEQIISPFLLVLLVPKYKKAFINSITPTTLKGMQYDEADKYWAKLKGDTYNFTGHDYETRTKDLQIPQAVKVTM